MDAAAHERVAMAQMKIDSERHRAEIALEILRLESSRAQVSESALAAAKSFLIPWLSPSIAIRNEPAKPD